MKELNILSCLKKLKIKEPWVVFFLKFFRMKEPLVQVISKFSKNQWFSGEY
jgi:hypothetical protein